MLKYQKCNTGISDSEVLVKSRDSRNRTAPLFRHKGLRKVETHFFRWLLSLCYVINIRSYSSHLYMLLPGPSEKVLISRFVERKSSKLDCSVYLAEICNAIRRYEKRKASEKKKRKDLAV